MKEKLPKLSRNKSDSLEFFFFLPYRIVGICLGIPPETFTWEYYDKSKKAKKVGPISPKAFYEEHVKPVFDMDQKVKIARLVRH